MPLVTRNASRLSAAHQQGRDQAKRRALVDDHRELEIGDLHPPGDKRQLDAEGRRRDRAGQIEDRLEVMARRESRPG